MSKMKSSRVAFGLSIACFLLLLPRGITPRAGQQAFVADKFFKESVGLSSGQIESIHRGKAIATSIDSSNPDQVFIFGTVYINAAPESYLKLANDIDALRKLPGYLAVQKFSNPPRLSDSLDDAGRGLPAGLSRQRRFDPAAQASDRGTAQPPSLAAALANPANFVLSRRALGVPSRA